MMAESSSTLVISKARRYSWNSGPAMGVMAPTVAICCDVKFGGSMSDSGAFAFVIVNTIASNATPTRPAAIFHGRPRASAISLG